MIYVFKFTFNCLGYCCRCNVAVWRDNYNRTGHIINLYIDRNANHYNVHHIKMFPNEFLYLTGRHLHSLVLDNVLFAIDQKQMTIGVKVADVTGAQPSICGRNTLCFFFIIQISLNFQENILSVFFLRRICSFVLPKIGSCVCNILRPILLDSAQFRFRQRSTMQEFYSISVCIAIIWFLPSH